MTTLHDRAIKVVEGHPQIQDWSVRSIERRSHQLYHVRDRVESQRVIHTQRAVVEIHRDLLSPEGEARRGSSSFTFLSDDDSSAARHKLEETVFAASLALNPPYSLPGSAAYPEVATLDTEIEASPEEVLAELGNQLLAQLGSEPQIRPSSAEFFAHLLETRLTNSQGVEGYKRGTQLFVELVLLSSDGSEESEFLATLERCGLQNLNLREEVAKYAERARDSLQAGIPETCRGPVAISGPALVELFRFLRYASSGAMKYQNLSRWEVGQPIWGQKKVQGEPLTLVADAILPMGVGSVPFDDDGVPGQQTTLVEQGILERFWADYRHAQYLDLSASGAFGNLRIPGGVSSVADLLASAGRLFHIVSFAAMDPDPITGRFVGEIRLGYDVGAEGARPFKGGALSGDMESALADVRFSRETVWVGDYQGPELALFGDLSVGGG